MPLIDDLAAAPTRVGEPELRAGEPVGRRKFLGLVGLGALGAAGAGTAVTAVSYLRPNALYETSSRLKVGAPATIPPGAVLSFPAQKLYVVHAAEGFYALSATCTHLGCLTRFEAEHRRIFCPCHGSRFDTTGAVQGGPAPKPLPRVKMTLEQGVLVVDTATLVGPDQVLKV